MINRRRFLQCVAAAAATPAVGYGCKSNVESGFGLIIDRDQILDLAKGLSYRIISRQGEAMSDGFVVPGAHDGMAAFRGENGRVVVVRNHELSPAKFGSGPFGGHYADIPNEQKALLYDRGNDLTPGLGGTTTSIYNPVSREIESQFLSLAGTEVNCAGGPTPWGSWLSCEESFGAPGSKQNSDGISIHRQRRHGYVFEVPSSARSLVNADPIRAMGRFEHEAIAVHEVSGVIYLTEDRWHSLLYRFVPNVPGQLREGGKLQALAIVDRPSQKTHNWDTADVYLDQVLPTEWIDFDDVDSDDNDLRTRGAANGAAMFARGEGITVAGDRIAFTCTIGGPAKLGQVFTYKPSPYEGESRERETPGQLTLIAECDEASLLTNCDNLTMAPWGDLVVCEDIIGSADGCSLIGIRPDGSRYRLASNSYSNSELAGVCFSPDGKTMFVNIQYPGMTLAITGDWPTT